MLLSRTYYRHRAVRDLAWATGSPPLVIYDDPDVMWPAADWYANEQAAASDWLAMLDADPRPLTDHCRDFCNGSRRLGCYFEALLAWWFMKGPRYALLAHDLQIQRHGRTLGAADFIVRDLASDEVIHVEATVKFYLGRHEGGWVGPNSRDTLERKFKKVCQHQSRLSFEREMRDMLHRQGIYVDSRRVIFKGRLFYPVDTHPGLPDYIAPGHLRGQWWRTSRFLHHFEHASLEWVPLDRLYWLSELKDIDQMTTHSLSTVKRSLIDADGRQDAICLAAVDTDGNEVRRVFVLPDDG